MQIVEEIRKFITENFIWDSDENLGDEDSLLEKGIIDSTGVLELVAFVEERYGIKFADDELLPENLDSIRNISNYIFQKMEFRAKLDEIDNSALQKTV